MGRKILFITTDQQRYDSLGCNGGTIARTPVVDELAVSGVNYRRAHNQNVVCMPARSTMITGQYVRTHGVYANGVPLPVDAPSVAAYLHEKAGYRTALIGKAHFEPALDPDFRWFENRMAREGSTGPSRGFEHMELAMHGYAFGRYHYDRWLKANFPEERKGFYRLFTGDGLNPEGGGDTGAPQVKVNPIPREHYHTDWVADRTIAFLDTLRQDEDWFVWMSFPDPHHPWDPPASEIRRVDWRDLDLPPGHPGSPEKIIEILSQKPHHWLDWYEGRFNNLEGGPAEFAPARMTLDQVREVNALIHIKNELVDEACGRVLRHVAKRGWDAYTDVFFTTDHGELQGDFGLLFKGPYHTDALMRIPFVWRPALEAGVDPAEVNDPVGQVDLAPTFCEIAGLPPAEWMQGAPLPTADGSGRERVITEWDSQFSHIDMHLRTIYRDGWVCTVYEKGALYDGTEGELYNLAEDPLQWRNLWGDAGYAARKKELIADLYEHLPAERKPRLTVEAPA
jgi:arylsulfatase A-like enzyme